MKNFRSQGPTSKRLYRESGDTAAPFLRHAVLDPCEGCTTRRRRRVPVPSNARGVVPVNLITPSLSSSPTRLPPSVRSNRWATNSNSGSGVGGGGIDNLLSSGSVPSLESMLTSLPRWMPSPSVVSVELSNCQSRLLKLG
eukprot:CAMPEP_0114235788 /NCGR_PEP_ID=MMETSP0058-20121206/6445_1 /TAXON_ID=36894 /ORGANISM="Pyramimonas parkeae, CCMP726" /LENGTH=139 /DNA_ID=CAMNT_0001347589 /DNA_START=269 /DNA_END=688 /DNA_ORIENTATION=+